MDAGTHAAHDSDEDEVILRIGSAETARRYRRGDRARVYAPSGRVSITGFTLASARCASRHRGRVETVKQTRRGDARPSLRTLVAPVVVESADARTCGAASRSLGTVEPDGANRSDAATNKEFDARGVAQPADSSAVSDGGGRKTSTISGCACMTGSPAPVDLSRPREEMEIAAREAHLHCGRSPKAASVSPTRSRATGSMYRLPCVRDRRARRRPFCALLEATSSQLASAGRGQYRPLLRRLVPTGCPEPTAARPDDRGAESLQRSGLRRVVRASHSAAAGAAPGRDGVDYMDRVQSAPACPR